MTCKHCGTAEGRIIKFKYGDPYCWQHYLQMRRHGKMLERTKYTPNEIAVFDTQAEITLYEGENKPIAVALVDLDDLPEVQKYKWHRTGRRGPKVYAETYIKKQAVLLHTFLLGKQDGCEIDHANANGLDNRRSNLRFVSHHQNVLNSRTNPKSGRMGITWRADRNCWVARILINAKARHRHFNTFDEAVKCRQDWERQLVGTTVEDLKV